jgi:hypothetical protein
MIATSQMVRLRVLEDAAATATATNALEVLLVLESATGTLFAMPVVRQTRIVLTVLPAELQLR